MQETVNKRRLLSLTVLTVITLLAFWWIQPENRLHINEELFQVEDLASVSRVALVSDTSSVILAFNGTRWRVNDRYNADPGMIRLLFATLQQARPKRAASRLRQDSLYRHLEAHGMHVSLYSGQELRKQFFAGGNPARTQAFFADPVSGDVYVMTIPGYRVYVSGIFELGEAGWRDKFVFGFNWRNFKTLEAHFLRSPAESFRVTMDGNYFGVEGLVQTDTARLNTFLDDVSLLTVDEYVHEPRLRDSLFGVDPQFRIEIRDAAGHHYRLRLYNKPGASAVYGIVQDSTVALFARQKIQHLLKPKSFFEEK